MNDTENLNHTRWECKYHVVFIPKGRRKLLYERLRYKVRGMTFAQWSKIYLERYAHQKRSIADERRYIGALCEFFGNVPIADFTRAHVEACKATRKGRLSCKGPPVIDATVTGNWHAYGIC